MNCLASDSLSVQHREAARLAVHGAFLEWWSLCNLGLEGAGEYHGSSIASALGAARYLSRDHEVNKRLQLGQPIFREGGAFDNVSRQTSDGSRCPDSSHIRHMVQFLGTHRGARGNVRILRTHRRGHGRGCSLPRYEEMQRHHPIRNAPFPGVEKVYMYQVLERVCLLRSGWGAGVAGQVVFAECYRPVGVYEGVA